MYLSMAVESTSKSDIFRDVRFFLAEESNEEVCSELFGVENTAITLQDFKVEAGLNRF